MKVFIFQNKRTDRFVALENTKNQLLIDGKTYFQGTRYNR